MLRDAVLATLVLFQPQGAIERSIEFESIGKAAPVASEPKRAVVFFAENLGETDPFRQWLSAEHAAVLARLDYNTRMAVAVFRGAVGTSGYAIRVQEVKAEERRLEIVAQLQDPKPRSMGIAAFTSPYHLVTIAKLALADRKPDAWVLKDTRGQVLARAP
jgi:hypothetical protein